MRVNAAIVASLTGAAFAYPVLDSYKDVKEAPAYGEAPQAPAYGVAPQAPTYTAPEPEQEHTVVSTPKQKTETVTPVPQKQTTGDCILKRSALGLDLAACAKGSFSGSLGASRSVDAPKAPQQPSTVTEPFVPQNILDLTELTKTLEEVTDISDAQKPKQNQAISDSSFEIPVEKDVKQILPKDDSTVTDPSSGPLSFVSTAAKQLEKTRINLKRDPSHIRPAVNADGKVNGELSDNDSVLAPLGLTGSLSGAATGSASAFASSDVVKRNALHLSDAAESASLSGKASGKAHGELSGSATALPIHESTSFGAKSAANAHGDLSDSTTGTASGSLDFAGNLKDHLEGSAMKREAQLSLDTITALLTPLTGEPAAPGAAASKRDLQDSSVDGADFLSNVKTQLEGQLTTSTSAAANADAAGHEEDTLLRTRNAQLSLATIEALLAPITGSPAPKAGSASKRQLGLDSIEALLAPLTGSPAPKAGSASKRQLSLDSIEALLAPLTGSPAPKAGGASKRQLSLDSIEALLAPLLGSPAPKAGGASKRQLGLDTVTGLLAPLTGVSDASGAAAKRDLQSFEDLEEIPQPANINLGTGPLEGKLGEDAFASSEIKSTQEQPDILRTVTKVLPVRN